MCGLAGYITNKDSELSRKHRRQRTNIFNGLLVSMEERGNQSAGVAFIGDNEYGMVKAPLTAKKFIQLPRYRQEIAKNYPLVLGHTRLATTGRVSKRNAHPFKRGNIVGTHNGWVTNWRNFDREETEVDSEVIFNLLDKSANDFKATFSKLEGSFAVAWANIMTDNYTLYLAVDGGPIHISYIPNLKTLFWASTYMSLKTVLSAHYKKPEIQFIKQKDCIQVDSNLKRTFHQIETRKYFDDGKNYNFVNDTSYTSYSYPERGKIHYLPKKQTEDEWTKCYWCKKTIHENDAWLTKEGGVIICWDCCYDDKDIIIGLDVRKLIGY